MNDEVFVTKDGGLGRLRISSPTKWTGKYCASAPQTSNLAQLSKRQGASERSIVQDPKQKGMRCRYQAVFSISQTANTALKKGKKKISDCSRNNSDICLIRMAEGFEPSVLGLATSLIGRVNHCDTTQRQVAGRQGGETE